MSNSDVGTRFLFGGNYRMGEIEAAVALVQLGRLEELIEPRVRNAERLTAGIEDLDGIRPPVTPKGLSHVYYLYAFRVPGSASRWAEALTAEGIPASTYVKPLYNLPVFRGFALPYDGATTESRYPETEAAYREVVVIPHVHAGMTDEDVDDVIEAIRKVWSYRRQL